MQEIITTQDVFKTPKETVAQSDIDDVIDDFNDLLYEYDILAKKFPTKYYFKLPRFNYIAKHSYSGRIYIRTYDEYLAIVRNYNNLLKLYLKMQEYLLECLEEEELKKQSEETFFSICFTGIFLLIFICVLLKIFGVE